MSYPREMLLQQLRWAYHNWQRLYFDQSVPEENLRCWIERFFHFLKEFKQFEGSE